MPSAPANGKVEFTHRRFGDVAPLSCADGFELSGAAAKVCGGRGQWSLSNEDGSESEALEEPQCVRKDEEKDDSSSSSSAISCGHPGRVANARMMGTNFEYPSMVTIKCKAGYVTQAPPGVSNSPKSISKLGRMRCRKDGTWAGVRPVCVKPPSEEDEYKEEEEEEEEENGYGGANRNKCKKLGRLRHGSIIGGDDDNPVGTTVGFRCDYAYQLVGPAELICGSDGEWSDSDGSGGSGGDPMPKCMEVDCGDPGKLVNGWVDGDKTTLGSIITFQCMEGSTFDGISDRSKCLGSGEWSNPLPNCYSE